jgi:hypothetical protein
VGVGILERRADAVVTGRVWAWLRALAPVVAVLTTPDVPLGAAWVLLGCAVGALVAPGPWTALGVLACLPALLRGPAAPFVLGLAVLACGASVVGAVRARWLVAAEVTVGAEPDPTGGARGLVSAEAVALAVAAVVAVLAAKQWIAAGGPAAWVGGASSGALRAATEPVPGLLVGAFTALGVVVGLQPPAGPRVQVRRVAFGLMLAALGPASRMALALMSPEPRETLLIAERLSAVHTVYDRFARTGSPELLRALVRASPNRDPAALALGWPEALDLGWRPHEADGVLVDVAAEMERRGRGGEALRLLARAPREGAVDWLRALFEVTQGVPVAWRGGRSDRHGTTVPGWIEDAPFAPSVWTTELTALAPSTLHLRAATDGGGTVEAVLDAQSPIRWTPGPEGAEVSLGIVPPGPHRVRVRVEGGRFAGTVRLEGR